MTEPQCGVICVSKSLYITVVRKLLNWSEDFTGNLGVVPKLPCQKLMLSVISRDAFK